MDIVTDTLIYTRCPPGQLIMEY